MSRYNQAMTDMLLSKFKDLSFDIADGRFMADKSYGFDTMFFMSRFIEHFRFGLSFDKQRYRDRANNYTSYLFMLTEGAAQVQNYLTETISTLCFSGVLKTVKRMEYQILDEELLLLVSSSFENAYIFLYMLAYSLYQKYGWWELYQQFCSAKTIEKKQQIVYQLREEMVKHNPNVSGNTDSDWAMFVTKYPLVVLNYANGQNHIARTGIVHDRLLDVSDIALNTQGTRSNYGIPKKNDYLFTFSKEYIIETLRPYLAVSYPSFTSISYSPSLAVDIADTKLHLYDQEDNVERKRKEQDPKYKQTPTGKVRTVQSEFRSGLLINTPHKCPVCGFEFTDFLIASHIKPYSKCEDTYDAMNYNNGLLMCPICDKLFEDAHYMTIDSKTGEIIYTPSIETEKDFSYLHNKVIDSAYIDCERKHYLKWHNDRYYATHSGDTQITQGNSSHSTSVEAYNVGTKVTHKSLGEGEISSFNPERTKVKVLLDSGNEMTFLFPDAFKKGYLKKS